MSGNISDLVEYRKSRALETILEAKTMIDNKFWNAAINRIYYACYYMVCSLLIKYSLEVSSHKGVRLLFGLHFVQTGLISKQDGRFFSVLFDKRQTGDYDDFIIYSEEETKIIYHKAEEFLNKVKHLIEQ